MINTAHRSNYTSQEMGGLLPLRLSNAEKINCRVFQYWVNGRERQPVTWASLVDVLRDTGLNKLAGDVEQMAHST